jgi:hypothetical protein
MKMFGAHVKHVIGVQVSSSCCYGTTASSNNCAPSVVRKAAGVEELQASIGDVITTINTYWIARGKNWNFD